MPTENTAKSHCPNCGAEVTANYCPNCGQKNSELNLPFRQLMSEFMGDVFTFDSRFFRTLIPLLTKPGLLTQKFNAGERVRYMSPLRLYLFISVIFFFILAVSDVWFIRINPSEQAQKDARTEAPQPADPSGQAEAGESSPGQDRSSFFEKFKTRFESKLMKAGRNEELLNTAVTNRLPQLMFLMVPVFALLLKVLYLRSDRLYIQHLVFGLHIHSFTFLILSVTLLLTLITEHPLILSLVLTIPAYLFMSMKRVYQQSTVMTLLKLLISGVIYFGVVLVALMVVVAITILLFE